MALFAANSCLQHVDHDLMSGTSPTPDVSHNARRANSSRALGSLLMCCALALCGDITTPASAGAPSTSPFDWSAVDSQPEQAAHILRQLHAWRKPDPSRSKKHLRVVYFYPHDRQPLKHHVDRWHQIMADIRQFYSDEMHKLGYGDVTLALEQDQGKLKLHAVRGTANDDGSYSYRSGNRIYNEVVKVLAHKGIDAQRETLLIVCGLSRTEDKKVTIYSPYYGMGADHTRGICFVADSDWLTINGLKPDPQGLVLQVKEHRGYEPFSLARFNTTYIGGTIHELGHGLSLPHNHATQWEAKRGTALMGAGNYTYRQEWRQEGKGSFLTHAHAIRLLVHPLFSGTAQQADQSPELQLTSLQVSFQKNQIQIRGTLQAKIPAVAMIAYNDRENPGQKGYQVNNDYDATTWSSVVTPQQDFWIRVGDLEDGNHQLRLVCVHANGSAVTHRLHYTMTDGIPDFDRTNRDIANIITP